MSDYTVRDLIEYLEDLPDAEKDMLVFLEGIDDAYPWDGVHAVSDHEDMNTPPAVLLCRGEP